MINALLWILLLSPLVGATVNGAVGRRYGRSFTTALALGSVAVSFAAALICVISYAGGPSPAPFETVAPFYWFDAGAFRLQFGLLLDPLSCVMILIVTGVGALIHVYSTGYMADDPDYNRYFAYLNLFMFSMLVLVLGNSFVALFVGWELVGLCSYLLIGFWYRRQSATDAGRKAFIVNRVGDWAFVIGIFLTFVLFLPYVGTGDGLRFVPVFRYLHHTWAANQGLPPELDLVPWIAALLFIGATGKSAQLPLLHVWLPDAMEGPTPVSALIHAATMVTAGVYMVARCHAFFVVSPEVMQVVAIIGLLTAFVAATTAAAQTDIKRVLAYSTISQLGFMFLGAGVGAFTYSIAHLMTHAFFKALLFLGSGAVIHALHNEQDMRKMGGLQKSIPAVGAMMGVGVLAIGGFPLLSGFFSKDAILGHAAGSSFLLWFLGTLTAFITAFYMTRLWVLTFYGDERWHHPNEAAVATAPQTPREPADLHDDHGVSDHSSPSGLHVPGRNMIWPMGVLAVLSVIGGAFVLLLPRFLEPVFSDMSAGIPEGHPFAPEPVLMMIAGVVALAGFGAGWLAYRDPKPRFIPQIDGNAWLANAWYIDPVAHWIFARGGEAIADAAYRDIEHAAIDRTAVHGAGHSVRWVSRVMRHMQTGIVADYALAMTMGAAAIVIYFLLR